MVVPKKNPSGEFEGLPLLVRRSLETLLKGPDNPLELGTAYDIIWRYLRQQNKKIARRSTPHAIAVAFDSLSEYQQRCIRRQAQTEELVDFLFERFNMGSGSFTGSKLNSVIVQAYVKADEHYNAAIEKEPSAELPCKRLAFMSLTSNRFLDAQRQWKELHSMRAIAGTGRYDSKEQRLAIIQQITQLVTGEDSPSSSYLHKLNVLCRNDPFARAGRKSLKDELQELGWFSSSSKNGITLEDALSPGLIKSSRANELEALQKYVPAEIWSSLYSILGLPDPAELLSAEGVSGGITVIPPNHAEIKRNFLAAEQDIFENINDEGGYLELYYHYQGFDSFKAHKLLECVTVEHPEFMFLRTKLASHLYVWDGEWVRAILELEDLNRLLYNEPTVIIPLIYLYEEVGMTKEVEKLWQDILQGLNSKGLADPASAENLRRGPNSGVLVGPAVMENYLWNIYGIPFLTSHHTSKIHGSRNSVHSVHNWGVSAFGLDFNVVTKFFQPDAKVVEYEIIETFRDIARRRPELGLADSLPTVRFYSEGMLTSGTCLVTVARGENLEHLVNEDNFKDNLRSAVKLLAAIHAASLEFPEGKLVDMIAENENYFEQRLRSIIFETSGIFPSPDESIVESFLSSYNPINSVLKSLPRCYYKDAGLKNWLLPPGSENVTAIDFERNWLLPPQLDLVSLLEFGSAYLDDDEIDGMLQTHHSSFCEFSQQDIPLSDFKEAYPYAAVQRHLEIIGYRKMESTSSHDPEELQRLETALDYHVTRAHHHLSFLAKKHSGAEREDILRLVELLPQLLPQLKDAQP